MDLNRRMCGLATGLLFSIFPLSLLPVKQNRGTSPRTPVLGVLDSPKTPEMSALVGGNGADSCYSSTRTESVLRIQNSILKQCERLAHVQDRFSIQQHLPSVLLLRRSKLHPFSFIPHPSSFILHPSSFSFIPPPSSLLLHWIEVEAEAGAGAGFDFDELDGLVAIAGWQKLHGV
jgi:hypothetical protein